jgi:hypothetical protein
MNIEEWLEKIKPFENLVINITYLFYRVVTNTEGDPNLSVYRVRTVAYRTVPYRTVA